MIAVICTARPSWAKLEPVCRALRARGEDVQIFACASALLERYGRVVDVIRAEGYPIAAECWTVHEGEQLITSAKETGALTSDLADHLSRVRPTLVVLVADRHEVLGAAQAAAYLHIPLLHMQGGERTGSIDNKVRDAITALADYHAVCTERAKYRVYGLVGDMRRIQQTGCPSIDLARMALDDSPVTLQELGGHGADISLKHPFLVVLQHPNTEEADQAGSQMHETLTALERVNLPRIIFWPGEDAGAGAMSKAIRTWTHHHPDLSVHTVRNLPPRRFLKLLTQARVLVGNSSAGIRECSYLGVPVVDIGTRQQRRERASNVQWATYDALRIERAIRAQCHARYAPQDLYGTGCAGERTAQWISEIVSS